MKKNTNTLTAIIKTTEIIIITQLPLLVISLTSMEIAATGTASTTEKKAKQTTTTRTILPTIRIMTISTATSAKN